MDTAREQLVGALQDQAVVEVRRALAEETERVRLAARRRVRTAYGLLLVAMLIYYGVVLGWSTWDLREARREYVATCETYAVRVACVRQFAAVNRLDNSFAVGARWWWVLKLAWPVAAAVVMWLSLGRVASAVAVAWAVWRLAA